MHIISEITAALMLIGAIWAVRSAIKEMRPGATGAPLRNACLRRSDATVRERKPYSKQELVTWRIRDANRRSTRAGITATHKFLQRSK